MKHEHDEERNRRYKKDTNKISKDGKYGIWYKEKSDGIKSRLDTAIERSMKMKAH